MSGDVISAVARATAGELAPQYGPRLEAEVEAALHGGAAGAPSQYVDPIALGTLIVALAQFGYQVYSDQMKDTRHSRETLARAIRVERREHGDLTAAEEKVIEVVAAEIIKVADQN